MSSRRHCFHADPTICTLYNTPSLREICCHCGTVRSQKYAIPPGHGPYTPGASRIADDFFYAPGVDAYRCPAPLEKEAREEKASQPPSGWEKASQAYQRMIEQTAEATSSLAPSPSPPAAAPPPPPDR